MATEEQNPEQLGLDRSTSFLYQLLVAFPSWAGVIIAIHAMFLTKSAVLRIRLR
jgi:hypothetical protein